MMSQTQAFFSYFYPKWMTELEDILSHLQTSTLNPSLDPAGAAFHKLSLHHRKYYITKWIAARDDVMAFFAPVWLSPFESAHLWVSGWRPSTTLNLLGPDKISGLTEAQVEKIASLKVKVKLEEENVEKEMERQQTTMTGAGGCGGSGNQVGRVQEAAAGMEKVMRKADCVRMSTLKGVGGILSSKQNLEFCTAMTILQIRTWKLGMHMIK